MRQVKQRHKTGCGPASLAMLTGISYQKALKLMLPKRRPRECACTGIHDMLRAIEKLGLKCDVSFKKVKLDSLKKDAMLIVSNPRHGKLHTGSHALVWDSKQKRIIDPWGWKSKIVMDKKYIHKHLKFSIALANR